LVTRENTEVLEVDGLQFRYRPNTYDKTILTKEWGPYAKRIFLNSTDRWLDLGGHIGLFTCHVAPQVAAVTTVEACNDNFWLLTENVELNRCFNVTRYLNAAVGKAVLNQEVTLYLNQHDNTGLHTLRPTRGRIEQKVMSIGIGELMLLSKPNKMKIDIEGGEVDILDNLSESHWAQLDEIILEYHFQNLRDVDHSIYRRVIELLKAKMGLVTYPEEPKKAWTCIIHAVKG
jgi:FkbM family methyltransferase